MDRYFLAHSFTNNTRYATSAFLRAKLGEAFSQRNIAPFHFYRKLREGSGAGRGFFLRPKSLSRRYRIARRVPGPC